MCFVSFLSKFRTVQLLSVSQFNVAFTAQPTDNKYLIYTAEALCIMHPSHTYFLSQMKLLLLSLLCIYAENLSFIFKQTLKL